MFPLYWSSHADLEPHESPFWVLFSRACPNQVGKLSGNAIRKQPVHSAVVQLGMHLFCIWTHALKTSVGRLRALSSELVVAGCFSENTALSHRWVLENILPAVRLREASHLLWMPSLWHQAAFWLPGTQVFNLREPLSTDAAHFLCQWIGESSRKHSAKFSRAWVSAYNCCV